MGTSHHRTAFIAIVAGLSFGATSSVDARELHWQGRRDKLWNHGVDADGVSNWYSQPVGGAALRAPNGGDDTVFRETAQETDITIARDEDVGSLRFHTTNAAYKVHVDAFLRIVGRGIFNSSDALSPRPLFTIRSGKGIELRNDANFDFGDPPAAVRVLQGGGLRFSNNSSGGRAVVSNYGGVVDFTDTASAAFMKITNRPQPIGKQPSIVRFYGTGSDGSYARFINGENSTLDFSASSNRAFMIENSGHLVVGTSRLKIGHFNQEGPGTLHIDRIENFHGTIVIDGSVRLGGTLLVGGFFGVGPGTYTLLRSRSRIFGKFANVDAFGGRIAYGANRVVMIVDPPPSNARPSSGSISVRRRTD